VSDKVVTVEVVHSLDELRAVADMLEERRNRGGDGLSIMVNGDITVTVETEAPETTEVDVG
jgi:hypothetical protein